jgi:hypothetical protein
MNRTLYFATMLITTISFSAIESSVAIDMTAVVVAFMLIFIQLGAGLFRWQNMGYNKWWGLLTLLPVVPFYGMIMPPNAKTVGIDTAGKVWLGTIIVLLVLPFIIVLFQGV